MRIQCKQERNEKFPSLFLLNSPKMTSSEMDSSFIVLLWRNLEFKCPPMPNKFSVKSLILKVKTKKMVQRDFGPVADLRIEN